jgi:integrase/recombinase XerC
VHATTNRAFVVDYLENLKNVRRLSTHTLSNYGRDLNELLAFVATENDLVLTSVGYIHLRKFASQLHSKGLKPRSIARKLSAWRGFFDWLSEQVVLASNPVNGIKAPKRSDPLPKALSVDDAVYLVAHDDPATATELATQYCNRAMFELLYSSGLRVSELVGLDVYYAREAGHESLGWVNFDAREVHVTGKGKKTRQVPVGDFAIEALTAWYRVRDTLVKTDPHPLFLSERGTRISVRVMQLRLKAHAQALDIPANVHPHMLRHSFASHILQSSGDLRAVQEMLGHESVVATQVYTSLDFQRLSEVYDVTHPRAKKTTK